MPVCIGGNSPVSRKVLATLAMLTKRFPCEQLARKRDSPAGSEASYTGTPMHVVVASHHRLPVEGYGGPQRVVVALVEGLAAHGHRVTVLAQPGTKLPAAARVVEVPPRTLKNSGADFTPFLPDNADILHAH